MNLGQWSRMLPKLEREYDADEDAETLAARILKVRHRAAVVTEVPASAPVGYLMVKTGDPFLYVGRGPGNKLARAALELVP